MSHGERPTSIERLWAGDDRVGRSGRRCSRLGGDGGQWPALFDEIGREHHAGVGSEVESVVRGARRDAEAVAGVQAEGRPVADLHLHVTGDDVTDLFAGVGMPAGGNPAGISVRTWTISRPGTENGSR